MVTSKGRGANNIRAAAYFIKGQKLTKALCLSHGSDLNEGKQVICLTSDCSIFMLEREFENPLLTTTRITVMQCGLICVTHLFHLNDQNNITKILLFFFFNTVLKFYKTAHLRSLFQVVKYLKFKDEISV